MPDITIPAEFIGDPEYDGTKETLTFFGSSAIRIAKILAEAREERERAERAGMLDETARHFAKQYAHQATSASGLLHAFHEFADRVLTIHEVQR